MLKDRSEIRADSLCVQEGNRGVVTGWGHTKYLGRSSRFLRKVTLPVVRYKDCTASTEQVIRSRTHSAASGAAVTKYS